MMRHLILAAMAIVLLCAPAQALDIRFPTTGSYAAIRKVALISAIGRFTLHAPGTGSSAEFHPDISSWQIDELAAATVKKYLGARFEFVDVPFDRAAIWDLPTRFMRETRTAAYLRTLRNPGVDAFILIHPAEEMEVPGPEGLSLQYDTEDTLWANFEIDIIDARTFRFIGKAHSHLREAPGGEPVYAAMGEQPGIWRGASFDLDQKQTSWLRRQALELVPRAVVETLRALELGVALPPPGDPSIARAAVAVDVGGARSIAVFSNIGSGLTLKQVSRKPSTASAPIPDWDLDGVLERAAGRVLAQKFDVRTPEVQRIYLTPLVMEAGRRIPNFNFPMPAGIDTAILILRAHDRQSDVTGLGVIHENGLIAKNTTMVDCFAILVLDVPNRRILKSVVFSAETWDPHHELDNDLWPDGGAAGLTPDLSAQLRAKLVPMLEEEISTAVRRVMLTADVPEAVTAR